MLEKQVEDLVAAIGSMRQGSKEREEAELIVAESKAYIEKVKKDPSAIVPEVDVALVVAHTKENPGFNGNFDG